MLTKIRDGMKSLTSRLGTQSDKASGGYYDYSRLDYSQLEAAYNSSWIFQAVVRTPAQDATRKWRQWSGDEDGVIRAREDDLDLRQKVYGAKWRARLYGSASLLIGVRGQDLSEPLDPKTVQAGDIEYLTILTPGEITAGIIEIDPRSARYGRPQYYDISTNTGVPVKVHPSRVVEFVGEEPTRIYSSGVIAGVWGLSVLQGIYETCLNLDQTMANVAHLVFDAKTDVIKVKGMMDNISDPIYESALIDRFSLVNQMKGNMATILLDSEEDYVSKTYSFTGIPDVVDRFMQICSAAADIPMTRLMGRSPGGMNSTGEHDMANYHDRLQAMQELELSAPMRLLDECLIRDALGQRPDDVKYEWKPLEQMSEKEVSEIRSRDAATLSTLASTRLYDDADVAKLGAQMLAETGLSLEVTDMAGQGGQDD